MRWAEDKRRERTVGSTSFWGPAGFTVQWLCERPPEGFGFVNTAEEVKPEGKIAPSKTGDRGMGRPRAREQKGLSCRKKQNRKKRCQLTRCRSTLTGHTIRQEQKTSSPEPLLKVNKTTLFSLIPATFRRVVALVSATFPFRSWTLAATER